jgi:hypothetical protein
MFQSQHQAGNIESPEKSLLPELDGKGRGRRESVRIPVTDPNILRNYELAYENERRTARRTISNSLGVRL